MIFFKKKFINKNNEIFSKYKVIFQQFLSYLNVVINGSDYDKAHMSFRFLDIEKKDKLD